MLTDETPEVGGPLVGAGHRGGHLSGRVPRLAQVVRPPVVLLGGHVGHRVVLVVVVRLGSPSVRDEAAWKISGFI